MILTPTLLLDEITYIIILITLKILSVYLSISVSVCLFVYLCVLIACPLSACGSLCVLRASFTVPTPH